MEAEDGTLRLPNLAIHRSTFANQTGLWRRLSGGVLDDLGAIPVGVYRSKEKLSYLPDLADNQRFRLMTAAALELLDLVYLGAQTFVVVELPAGPGYVPRAVMLSDTANPNNPQLVSQEGISFQGIFASMGGYSNAELTFQPGGVVATAVLRQVQGATWAEQLGLEFTAIPVEGYLVQPGALPVDLTLPANVTATLTGRTGILQLLPVTPDAAVLSGLTGYPLTGVFREGN